MYMYVPIYSCGVLTFRELALDAMFDKVKVFRGGPPDSIGWTAMAQFAGDTTASALTAHGPFTSALDGLCAGHERTTPHLEGRQEGREPPRHAPDIILAADALVDRRHRHAVAEHAEVPAIALVSRKEVLVDRYKFSPSRTPPSRS